MATLASTNVFACYAPDSMMRRRDVHNMLQTLYNACMAGTLFSVLLLSFLARYLRRSPVRDYVSYI